MCWSPLSRQLEEFGGDFLELCRPVWTAHSDRAWHCRGPSDVLRFYRDAASCSYIEPIERSTRVIIDVIKLEKIGFHMEYNCGIAPDLKVTELVQGESVNAHHMLNLWCNIGFHRIKSMMWHSYS